MKKECWARSLGDCAGGMSKEHIVSESILGPGPVTVSGFDWTGKKSFQIPISGASAKILCKKHNSDLSILDAEIQKIRDNLKKFYGLVGLGIQIGHLGPPMRLAINGKLFERWILKTTINHLVHSPKKYHDYWPEPYLVDLAFGKAFFDYSNQHGLYLVNPSTLGNMLAKPSTVSVMPNLIHGTNTETNSQQLILIGSLIIIFGVPLYLKVVTTQNLSVNWNGTNLLDPKNYHPGGMVILDNGKIDRSMEVTFSYK